MTFYMNLDLNTAFHMILEWAGKGSRTRMIKMANGRWFIAKLEKSGY